MTNIPLRAYNREIEEAIEQKQIEEAIAHCQHILKTFTKHVDTYRLLGKAYLESQRFGNAADIFKKTKNKGRMNSALGYSGLLKYTIGDEKGYAADLLDQWILMQCSNRTCRQSLKGLGKSGFTNFTYSPNITALSSMTINSDPCLLSHPVWLEGGFRECLCSSKK